MQNPSANFPTTIQTCQQFITAINQIGFLPLSRNSIKGFSAEDLVPSHLWYTGDPDQDPWVWREIIAGSREVVYGKFFKNKAGFISLKWFPVFANYKREGLDFDKKLEKDSWYAPPRTDSIEAMRLSKRIIDCFQTDKELTRKELKKKAVIGREEKKYFNKALLALQTQSFLVTVNLEKRFNKNGEAYGEAVSTYACPEDIWGEPWLSSAKGKNPYESLNDIILHLRQFFPSVSYEAIRSLLK